MTTDSLDRFKEMRDAVVAEYDNVSTVLEDLKREQKMRTATFKQLTARKLTLATLLDMYGKYDLL